MSCQQRLISSKTFQHTEAVIEEKMEASSESIDAIFSELSKALRRQLSPDANVAGLPPALPTTTTVKKSYHSYKNIYITATQFGPRLPRYVVKGNTGGPLFLCLCSKL